MTTIKRKIGDLGEKVAETFLRKHGYQILDRNYSKKWGEIDIVAKDKDGITFVEVKAIEKGKNFLPEQNIYFGKQKRLIRASQSYLLERKYPLDAHWQIDVVVVELDYQKRTADIRHIKNAVF